MAVPISFRPTEDDVKNLALLESTGLTRAEAIRTAIRAAANRCRQSQALRSEAERLRDDPVDQAALREVHEFFGDTLDELPV